MKELPMITTPKTLLALGCLMALTLSACGDKPQSETAPTPDAGSSATGKDGAGGVTKADADDPVIAKAKEIAAKNWKYLSDNYNQRPSPNPMTHFWGPDCNPGMSSFVVLGAVKAGVIEDTDPRIKQTVASIVDKQGANGSFDMNGKGLRAVYLTSAALQCLSYLRDHGSDYYRKGDIAAKLKSAAERAMDYLKRSQVGAPESPQGGQTAANSFSYGGWAYSEEELAENQDKPAANLSTTIFALDGAASFGLDRNDELYQRAIVFLKRNQNAGEVEKGIEIKDAQGRVVGEPGPDDKSYGGSRYSPESTKALEVVMDDGKVLLTSYGSMTYALLRGYLLAGMNKDDVPVKLAYQWITRNFVLDRVPGFVNTKDEPYLDQQGLYYQYMQLAKTLTLFGGNTIKDPQRGIEVDWRKELVDHLASIQLSKGEFKNAVQARWNEEAANIPNFYVINALGTLIAGR